MSSTVQRGFDPVPEYMPDESEHRRRLARKVNGLNQGKFNATGTVTLAANQTTTVLTDARIFATSFFAFMPTTAHATTAHASLFVTGLIKGQATLNHASSASTDQTFTYLVIG